MVNCSYCKAEIERLVFCNPSHKTMYHRSGAKVEMGEELDKTAHKSEMDEALENAEENHNEVIRKVLVEGTTVEERPTLMGFCEGHFEKGKQYPLTLSTLEDFNGEVMWKRNLCEACTKKALDYTDTKGGKLYT